MKQSNLVCPMCKGNNACTVQTDPYACWCMSVEVTAEQRQQLPELAQCLCMSCLEKCIALNESL